MHKMCSEREGGVKDDVKVSHLRQTDAIYCTLGERTNLE